MTLWQKNATRILFYARFYAVWDLYAQLFYLLTFFRVLPDEYPSEGGTRQLSGENVRVLV